MKMAATITLRVRVPFNYDAEKVEARTGRADSDADEEKALKDQAKAERKILRSRQQAARHAERDLVDGLKKSVGSKGKILDVVVEQVEEDS